MDNWWEIDPLGKVLRSNLVSQSQGGGVRTLRCDKQHEEDYCMQVPE